MKAMYRSGREEGDKYSGLMGMVQVLSFLVIFVAGIVIGIATSPHFNRYFTAQSEPYTLMNQPLTYTPDHVNKTCSTIRTCEKVDCLSMEAYLHPNLMNLSHGLSDDELFWRASMVPVKEEVPYERVPKVAFMFLTRGPLPLLPLWERFFKGHEQLFSVYVHSTPGFELNVSSASPFYKRQIPSEKVEWGTVGLVDAEKRLLANALLDYSNERFILLSESCIPVFNFSTVYKYLTNSLHSFADLFDDRSRYGRGRYSRNMYPDIKLHQWRKGSQWFELNRSLAIQIVSETKYYEIFRKHCKPACYPDEHYIATYLNMFHGSVNANRSVTWVDWSMMGPHPATYERVNVTEDFIRSIRDHRTRCMYNGVKTSTCYLFARKFSPSALEPLLNLSSSVMEF